MQREYMQADADLVGAAGSPWLVTEVPEHPQLVGDIESDAIVVGAGLTGALVARELTRRGLRVTVLERGRIASGTTGHSTAKITVLHGTDWSRAITSLGGTDDALTEWAVMNATAPETLSRIVAEDGIECRFRMVDGFLCERLGARDEALAKEWNALRSLSLPVDDAGAELHSPFGAAVVLRLAEQAQFDPAAFTLGVIGTLPGGTAQVFESTAVRSLSRAGLDWTARTDSGTARAPLVVMASLAPAHDPALLFARLFPYAHYAIQVSPPDAVPDGLWIQVTGSELTARPLDGAEGAWILSGKSARLAEQADERTLYMALQDDAAAEFGATLPDRYWSAEDYSTPDGLPFVGRVGTADGLYYAGGFGGWGMTKALVAAILLADEIEGKGSAPLRPLLSPNRFPRVPTWPTLLEENIFTARHLLFPVPAQRHAERAAPPLVPAIGSEPPRCTHMGCRTKVNTVEGVLDCPCHGSRFNAEGRPLFGPARRDATVAGHGAAQASGPGHGEAPPAGE